jgi:phosphatidylinositol-3,4,5-trisphosphate 3-phosphatase/dual-specificity protein phosphatase PTEN
MLLWGFMRSAPWPLLAGTVLTLAVLSAGVFAFIFAIVMFTLGGILALSMFLRFTAGESSFNRHAFNPMEANEVEMAQMTAKTELLSVLKTATATTAGTAVKNFASEIFMMITGTELAAPVKVPAHSEEIPIPTSAEELIQKVLEDKNGSAAQSSGNSMAYKSSTSRRKTVPKGKLPTGWGNASFEAKSVTDLQSYSLDKDREPSDSRSLERRDVEASRSRSKSDLVVDLDTGEEVEYSASDKEVKLDPDSMPPRASISRMSVRMLGGPINLTSTLGRQTDQSPLRRMVLPFEAKTASIAPSRSSALKDESRYLEVLKVHPVIPSEEVISLHESVVLGEVLTVPEVRADFRAFCAKNLCLENMEFIEAVELYKNLDVEKRDSAARNIFSTFIAPSAPKCINIDGDSRALVVNAVGSSNKITDELLFEKAYDCVIKMMGQDVFIQYKKSASFDAIVKQVIRMVLKKSRTPRLTGWTNSDHYQSLQVHITFASHLKLSSPKEKVQYTISVDSSVVTSDPAKPIAEKDSLSVTWKDPMRFSITSTTQHLEIEVFETASKRVLGRLFVPLVFVLETQGGIQLLELCPSPKMSEDPVGRIRASFLLSQKNAMESPTGIATRRKNNQSVSTFQSILMTSVKTQSTTRFVDDGFDLDLTYVTDHLIALAEPGQAVKGHSIDECCRFLELRHPNCYKIFGLCHKKPADPKLDFHIELYPVAEKAPAAFNLILQFCKDMDAWLSQFPQNVACVYCKTGKGRTGMMMCCYLLYSGVCPSADDAIELFHLTRCGGSKGITRPGHVQYIRYFEHYLKVARELGPNLFPETKSLYLCSLTILRAPSAIRGSFQTMWVEVYQKDGFYSSQKLENAVLKNDTVAMIFSNPVPISEDVTIRVHIVKFFRKEHVMSLYFNTRFIEESTLLLEKEIEIHNKKELVDKNAQPPAVALETKSQLESKEDASALFQIGAATPSVSSRGGPPTLDRASTSSALPSKGRSSSIASTKDESEGRQSTLKKMRTRTPELSEDLLDKSDSE